MSDTTEEITSLLLKAKAPKGSEPYIVPDNWIWVKMKDATIINMGQSPKGEHTTDNPNHTPLIGGPADMGEIHPKSNRFTVRPTKLSNKNDLIVSIRATLGKTNIADKTYCLGRGVVGITPLIVDLNLLRRYFELIEPYLYSISTGTTFQQISKINIENLYIPIPPLIEQKNLAEKVERLLGKIDEAKQLIEEAKESFELRRAAILDKAFRGELGTNDNEEESLISNKDLIKNSIVRKLPEDDLPINWSIASFNSVVKISSGNALTKKNMNEDGIIPVYGGNGITGNHDQSNIHEETIIIGRVGFYCGSIHMTPKLAWVTDNAFKVSFSNDLFDKKYLYWHLKHLNLNQFSNSSAQPVISGKSLQDVEVLIPPLIEQKKIAEKLEILLEKLDTEHHLYKMTIIKMEKLRDSILNKAFRGELGTNDPTEENALELLKEVLQKKVK